jgi:hypothetical protein
MKKLVFFALLLLLFGCGTEEDDKSKEDCYGQMDALIKQKGQPQETVKYDAGDYHDWTLWYWSKGISYSFVWGIDGCQTASYTFTPIRR